MFEFDFTISLSGSIPFLIRRSRINSALFLPNSLGFVSSLLALPIISKSWSASLTHFGRKAPHDQPPPLPRHHRPRLSLHHPHLVLPIPPLPHLRPRWLSWKFGILCFWIQARTDEASNKPVDVACRDFRFTRKGSQSLALDCVLVIIIHILSTSTS